MARLKALTVQEALDLIQDEDFGSDDDSHVDLVIVPPEAVDNITDEEDCNDEEIEVPDVSDVAGSLEAHVPAREKSPEPTKKRRKTEEEPRWRQRTPEFTRMPTATAGAGSREEEVRHLLQDKSPVTLFEELFTEEVYSHIIRETLRYAASTKNDQLFTLPVNDLKAFIGILLLTGYHKLPSERHYWSNAGDLGVSDVKEALTRNRYANIKAYLHLADNNQAVTNKQDRGFKVRPLMDMLNKTFQKFGVFSEELAIDEMMVKYFGRNSLKQFIRGKPVRFGYKMWALCGKLGYCFKFNLYCGKEENSSNEPLGTRVVLDMLKSVETSTDHKVYFDNFFTSRSLLVTLSDRGFRATGTVRENRTGRCPVSDQKTLKAGGRGRHERWFDAAGEVCLVKWSDNRCVTMLSNHESDRPLTQARRWDRAQRAHRNIPQPRLVQSYNQSMGGVDNHDWYCGKYATGIRGKKWYWALFTRMLDMAVVNAWVLHRIAQETSLPLFEFRREIAVAYLRGAVGSRPQRPTAPLAPPPSDLRYDGLNHLVALGDKQRHCRMENCKKRPSFQCVKCKVTLCIPCFVPYHTRPVTRPRR